MSLQLLRFKIQAHEFGVTALAAMVKRIRPHHPHRIARPRPGDPLPSSRPCPTLLRSPILGNADLHPERLPIFATVKSLIRLPIAVLTEGERQGIPKEHRVLNQAVIADGADSWTVAWTSREVDERLSRGGAVMLNDPTEPGQSYEVLHSAIHISGLWERPINSAPCLIASSLQFSLDGGIQ